MVQILRYLTYSPKASAATPKEAQEALINFNKSRQKTRQKLIETRENLLLYRSLEDAKKRRLVLYEKIGEGGEQSAVKLARDIDSSSDVALKFLPEKNKFTGNKLILKVKSPYVVRGIDHGVAEDGFGTEVPGTILIMEYADGKILYDKICNQLPTISEARTIFLQIALGLKDIFDCGILYLDLKPSNTMILNDSITKVKLFDFGIAENFPYDARGIAKGTIEYMSPEHAQGKILMPSSDIFSFGVLMYECLTNKIPEINVNIEKALTDRANYKESQITDFKPNTPFWLESLVRRCLRANPEKRPSITEIIETLSNANEWDSIKLRALSYLGL